MQLMIRSFKGSSVGGSASATRLPNAIITALLILIIGSGLLQVVLTYSVFSNTVDEPAHLAAGLEWLDRGSYEMEALHPPLARVAIAIGPYLAGARLAAEDIWSAGTGVLCTGVNYVQKLTLARIGVLPFFTMASVLVWVLTRGQFGDVAAIVATLLFNTLPPVLGHAAVATTDMPATATFLLAFWLFRRWLRYRTLQSCVLMSVGIAAALLTKYSNLVFLAATLPVVALFPRLRHDNTIEHQPKLAREMTASVVIIAVVIIGAYRFSVAPVLRPQFKSAKQFNALVGKTGRFHNLAYKIGSTPIPAPEFVRGVWSLYHKEGKSELSFVLNRYYEGAPWFFFVVALAVKTPSPCLLAAIAGLIVLTARYPRVGASTHFAAVPVLLLLVSSASSVKLGVRHILPIYPFIAILGGVAASCAWHQREWQYVWRTAVVLLVVSQIYCVVASAPDYLSYFNVLAGREPAEVLVESDLDWGQDLFRLSDRLRQLNVHHVSVAYFGPSECIPAVGLPDYTILRGNERVTGWVAVSESLKVYARGSYEWLRRYQPVAKAGKSIRIYYIPSSPAS